MKKSFSLALAMVMMLGLLTACGSNDGTAPSENSGDTAGSAEPTFHWRAQSVEGEGTPRYLATQWFCDRVAEKTNGRVEIDLYSSGTLHGTKEGYEAIKNGLTECTFTNPDYMAGYEPMLKVLAGRTTDMNNNFDDTMELLKLEEPLVVAAYSDLGLAYVGTTVVTPGEAFHTNVEVHTLEDMGKLTVRTAAMGQEMFEALGATVVNLDMTEVYNAAQLNVVNAFEVSGYMDNYQLALQEVCKYSVEPTIHITGCYLLGELLVDQDVWDTVPQDLKDTIAECVTESQQHSYDDLLEKHEEGRKLFEAAGVKTIYLDDGEAEKAKIIGGQNLHDYYWGQSERTDEFLNIYCDWLSSKGGDEIVAAIKG